MSLETLLEAAKYLEYRTEANARGEDPQDFVTFLAWSGAANNKGTFSSSATSNGNIDCLLQDVESKDRRRSGAGALGTREVHNKLEKNRRAHLKRCFESLKKQIPIMDEKKTSNLGILRSSLRYIQLLKRKEREYEYETERLAREKIALQQRLTSLKKELSAQLENIDINCLLPDVVANVPPGLSTSVAEDTNSTSTATECGPLSDFEDDEFLDDEASIDNISTSYKPLMVAAAVGMPEAVSKVRRTTELFRLLCDPPLSVQSLETEGPYIMYCQQTPTAKSIVPSHPPSVPPSPPATAAATVMATGNLVPKVTKGTSVGGGSGNDGPIAPFQSAAATAAFVLQSTQKVPRTAKGPTATLSFGSAIPSRVQVAPLAFPAQIVPPTSLHFNGSTVSMATAGHHQQPIQLLAQQTMRFISAPSPLINKLPSAALLNGPLQANTTAAAAAAVAPATTSKGQMVKVTAANGQSQIAIAQLAIKPATMNATLNFRPTAAAAGGGVKGPTHIAHLVATPSPTSLSHVLAGSSSLSQQPSLQQLDAAVKTDSVIAAAGTGTNNLLKTAASTHQLQFLSAPQLTVKPVVLVSAPPPPSSLPKDLADTKQH